MCEDSRAGVFGHFREKAFSWKGILVERSILEKERFPERDMREKRRVGWRQETGD